MRTNSIKSSRGGTMKNTPQATNPNSGLRSRQSYEKADSAGGSLEKEVLNQSMKEAIVKALNERLDRMKTKYELILNQNQKYIDELLRKL